MRFLKNKIAKAQEFMLNRLTRPSTADSNHHHKNREAPTSSSQASLTPPSDQPKGRRRVQGMFFTSERARATKNVVKNYGKAICSFAVSDLALPYLIPILEKENVIRERFVDFIASNKDGIDSIQSFRSVLLIDEDDSPEIKAFKKSFALIAEVFIKCFSVNWIFSGRITHKEAHLKFRFKMLRRIRQPENFFYIQKSSRKNKKAFW